MTTMCGTDDETPMEVVEDMRRFANGVRRMGPKAHGAIGTPETLATMFDDFAQRFEEALGREGEWMRKESGS